MKKKEHIILVHGTFAFEEGDFGSSWWQFGSEFRTKLKSKLNQNYEITFDQKKPAFKWSGNNLLSARKNAAKKLLKYVLELENREINYHIIGHSHGGNIVYQMLNDATKINGKKKFKYFGPIIKHSEYPCKLKHLKGWTTLGTPFLKMKQNEKDLSLSVSRNLIIPALLLTIPFILFHDWFYLVDLESFNIQNIIRTLSLFIVLFFMGKAVDISEFRFDVISYPHIEKYYSNNWQGIYSKNDEAILALQIAENMKFNDPKSKIIPSLNGHWTVKFFIFFYKFIENAISNIFIPLINLALESKIKISALGLDSVSQIKMSVQENPFSSKQSSNLNEDFELKMLQNTTQSLSNDILMFKELIPNIVDSDFLNKLFRQASMQNKSLIHTSYFDYDEIIELIANHILKKSASNTE